MTYRNVLFILLMLLLALPVGAQDNHDDAAHPTLTALRTANLPMRDRSLLAQQFNGVTAIPAPPASAPLLEVGAQRPFWVTNSFTNESFQINATLWAAGQHIYLWVQDGYAVDRGQIRTLGKLFDTQVYEQARALWGSEANPGVDGDPRVHGLFAAGLGPTVGAYYTSEHSNPVEVVPTSNEHEMFIFNLDTLGTAFQAENIIGVVAHEFQHMIRQEQDGNEDGWLDEGFSSFTEVFLGFPYGTQGSMISFLAAPGTQLNTWAEDGPRAPHYGNSLMFVAYLYERLGEDALRALSVDPVNGLNSVADLLADFGGPDVDTFFADWVVANHLFGLGYAHEVYGYDSLPPLWDTIRTPMLTGGYPASWDGRTAQYATAPVGLAQLGAFDTLHIEIELPATAPLIPTDAASGQWMWYSNRGDESYTSLTRSFDLTGVDSATLNYRVWYHIENLWDYGYVLVSADDGATWTPLQTPAMTTENPHFTAYGPGYSGLSGGWRDESISLDAYAGQEIQVRFAMITDDAVNQPGMAIDDVSVPEIDYASDFENGADDWQAEGWVLIDNVLPQRMWAQVVQFDNAGALVLDRWEVVTGERWSVPLVADTATLLLSPFAPVTTVPAGYNLRLTTE